ncbi:hypothetical protein GCM10011507_12080 [Edaphobacter acidisoli]|uniref:Carboxypeptidase regulatory-like domain-containing protein n=1 Tax=Edaphobacter acidisoli TaxID=2040573 RepID=A0A916W2H0_9BACT|nr:hypothetical protein [Edaphobacter acidisoli]GGA62124.1 hypothetical protein GCM10011507_12080 [Edaphobacter acidisoli]
MPLRRSLGFSLAFTFCLLTVASSASFSQEQHYRGRKYKAPPPTAHIEVEVLRKDNGKPLMNAAVVFNPFDQKGKDLGNLEVKTGPDGKAVIDIIPVGSTVDVQVIATGFSTFAQQYEVDSATKDISVSMIRPRAQVSAYQNNEDKASERKPGVQEPDWPNLKTNATSQTNTAPPASGSTPPPSGSSSSGSSQNSNSSNSNTK